MPRVHKCKASKDYPEHGIKKGDTYYHWAFFRGRKQMSKKPPRRSQTTAAPNLSAAYAAHEALEDSLDSAKTVEDVKSALDDAMSMFEEVLSDYDDTISNLEQAFSGGCPALEEKQEQRDAIEGFKDELDSASSEVDNISLDDHLDEPARLAKWTAEQEAEHDGEEGWELDESAFELPTAVNWDDLMEEEQNAALEEALEFARGPDFSV